MISAYRSTLPVHLNKKFNEIIIAKAEKEGKTSTENSSKLSIIARFFLLLTILTTTFLKLVALVVTQIGILPEFFQLLVVRILQPLVLFLFVFFGVKYPQYVLIFIIAVWLIARAVGTNKKDKVAPIDECTDVKNVNDSDESRPDQIQSHKHHHHRHSHRSRHQEGEENRHRHRNQDRPREERSHHHRHHSRREEQESRRQHHRDHHDNQSEQSESSNIEFLETNNLGHEVENDHITSSRHQEQETASVVNPDLSDDDDSVSTLKSLNNSDDRPIVPSLLASPARQTFDISSSSSSSSPSSSLPRTANEDNEVHDSRIVLSTYQLSPSLSAASLLPLSNDEVIAPEHTHIESMLSLSSDEIFSEDGDENDVDTDTNNGNVINPNNETITDTSRQHIAIKTLQLADMRFYDQYLSSSASSSGSSVEEGGVQESPDNNINNAINISQDTNVHTIANSNNGSISQVMLRSIEDIIYSDTSTSESSKSESSLDSSDAVSSSSSSTSS